MATLTRLIVRIGGDVDGLERAAQRAERLVGKVGRRLVDLGDAMAKSLGKISVGQAPAAALAGTLGATASSLVAAGAAAGAFHAALAPQLTKVTDSYELYTAAQDAAALGGQEAAEAQQAYLDSLAGMPPATRDAAVAFTGLREDVAAWSDSLSGTTMPVVTKGLQLLRRLLPSLTPLVRAAGGAFSGLLDDLDTAAGGGGFQRFVGDLAARAGPAITSFGHTVGNLALGLGRLVQALLPANSGINDLTGGLEAASGRFAEWAGGLQGSEGLARFADMAGDGGQALGNLATAAARLLVALAPLLGTTTLVANALATVVSNVPIPVLTTLAAVIAAVSIATRLWAAYTAAAYLATRATAVASAARQAAALTMVGLRWVWAGGRAIASAGRQAAAWAMTGARATAGVAAQVAGLALTGARWLAAGAMAMAGAAMMAGAWLLANWPIVLAIAVIAGFVFLIIKYWDQIKNVTVGAWSAVTGAISGAVNFVINWVRAHWPLLVGILTGPIGLAVLMIVKHWDKIKAGGVAVYNWITSLPGKVSSALSGLGPILAAPWKFGFNQIARFWNSTVAKIGFKAPQWVPRIGGKGWSVPAIPMLATGGTIKTTGLALLHERETVLPAGVAPLPRGATGAGGGGAVVEIRSSGRDVDDFILEALRRGVRSRGGNVQAAVGA